MVLAGLSPDQAAEHGFISQWWNLGLELSALRGGEAKEDADEHTR
jgi:hypothetical protein